MSSANRGDTITISSLSLHLSKGLGPSAFSLTPPPPCPAIITLDIRLVDEVVPSCSNNDAFGGLGINYSSISKEIIALSNTQSWDTPHDLLRDVSSLVTQHDVVDSVSMSLRLPRASLAADAIVYSAYFSRSMIKGDRWKCKVDNLQCRTVVGLHPYEQQQRQRLELDVEVEGYDLESWNHVKFADTIYEWLEPTNYGTLEALVDQLARHLLGSPIFGSTHDGSINPRRVNITLRKPSALPYATPGIMVSRTSSDYPSVNPQEASTSSSHIADQSDGSGSKVAYVALGSNIGDRIGHIRKAVASLEEVEGIEVRSTSRLYESEPMYVEDQDRFINGAIEIETLLSPLETLRALKKIERSTGRTKTFRNGPRVVDLDLLIYDNEPIKVGKVDDPEDGDGVGWLEVPHPRIGEREFVLRPLTDRVRLGAHTSIDPHLQPYNDGHTVSTLLSTLLSESKPSLAPIIPFPYPALPVRLDGYPKIMQIFNATPDSFSDGDESNLDPEKAMEKITRLFDNPFPPHILDIGGMSTRPNSQPCSIQEEIDRVVPLIKLIRSSLNPSIAKIPISVDTYRSQVASLAIEAGSSCINDVRGGREQGMTQLMAQSNVPIVLMHSRGDSTSMTSVENTTYPDGVLHGVRNELGKSVDDLLAHGVKKWDIILDPGLGFAKTHQDNLRLLNGVSELNKCGPLEGLPILVGGSRKGFVGKVVNRGKEQVTERGYGDAGVVAWCCAQKSLGNGTVDIVRVHDGRAMSEVVAMWRAMEGEV